jgi:hypothetical protein
MFFSDDIRSSKQYFFALRKNISKMFQASKFSPTASVEKNRQPNRKQCNKQSSST